MTPQEALTLVGMLQGSYPRPEMTKATVNIYARMLMPLPFEAVQSAVERLLLTAKFLPTIAEIREAMTANVGTPYPTAGDAWATVLHWVRKVGGYGTVPQRTPQERLIARCIEAVGGWQYLCHETDNIMADRAHFLKVYGENVQREQQRAAHRVWPLPEPPVREHVADQRTAERVAKLVSHVIEGATDVSR